jgi:hypothetical protein
MAAAEGGAPGLKPLSSFNSRANQQDLLAALNARIAKETAELADLRAKVAKERERYVGGNPASRIQFMTAAVLGHCVGGVVADLSVTTQRPAWQARPPTSRTCW